MTAGNCTKCSKGQIADSSVWNCHSCLAEQNKRNRENRQTVYGRWAHHIRTYTRKAAGGFCKSSPTHLGWTHEEFIVRFVDYRKGDKRVIDHQIPKKCARLPDGGVDREFAWLVAGLENLQLLTQSANIRKGGNLDRKDLTKSNELRARGLSGATLFHALWNEFSEQAQKYGDLAE